MKTKKADAEKTWKEMEDLLIPQLKLDLTERVIYSHLVRHSRLEGRGRFHFSIGWLARGTRMTYSPARNAVRRLAEKGALRLVERSRGGHVVDVLVPVEIAACHRTQPAAESFLLEAVDFLRSRELRNAIHRRENARCFYCFRFLSLRVRALDHVVPRVSNGHNSYRNLVSCCTECNARKGEMRAEDFLRQLFREGRINAAELEERTRAVKALAAGKLKPAITAAASPKRPNVPLPRRGRPRLHPAA
ncbi:MAG: HNH endonuclease [Acidobacteria bacterium]|nr:HNH endonuclease [Acidobacteriota bacterium]MCL5288480.1 HNH endonuclease [Acidobacteriota bacterium]